VSGQHPQQFIDPWNTDCETIWDWQHISDLVTWLGHPDLSSGAACKKGSYPVDLMLSVAIIVVWKWVSEAKQGTKQAMWDYISSSIGS